MTINFLGDIGLFKRYEDLGIDPFREVELPPADLSVGNFEFMVPDNRDPRFYDIQKQYSCSPAYLKSLDAGRIGGLNLANNHCLDYGPEGVRDTIAILKDKGVTIFGYSSAPGYNAGQFELGDIRVAIIGCVKPGRWSRGENGSGPDPYDAEKICLEIGKLRKTFNHIIVFPHWGTELVEVPGYIDTVNARMFIEKGASAVIGHHPHIVQGVEPYRGGIIAYSLGSFIYIPEDELGYNSTDRNRDISLCLNIRFGKDKIEGFEAIYYRYNAVRKVPERVDNKEVMDYTRFLNNNIHNRKLYRKQVRSRLLKREIRSFFKRFRTKPFATLYNYAGLLRPGKIKKLISS